MLIEKQNGLNNRQVIKQGIELTHAKTPLSRAELDLILVLIAQIKQEDTKFKDYHFTLKELSVYMGRELQSKQIRNLVMSLLEKPLLLPIEGMLDSEHWMATNWFSYFTYNNGVISCAFNERLQPFLLDIKGRYSIGSLKTLLSMKSKYSKELYLVLSSEAYKGFYEVEVIDLMKKLQVPKSLLNYADFKRKVLIQSKQDMDKFSDISFELEESEKIRKRVIKIKFHITRNLNDLKAFIKTIRELYTNVPLVQTKDGVLQCSTKGYLYIKDKPEKDIHPKTAEKLWQNIHEKRDALLIFKDNQENIT